MKTNAVELIASYWTLSGAALPHTEVEDRTVGKFRTQAPVKRLRAPVFRTTDQGMPAPPAENASFCDG
jgi:hypothetical protein